MKKDIGETRKIDDKKLPEREKRHIIFCKKWRQSPKGNWTILHTPDGSTYKSATIIRDKFKVGYNLLISSVDENGKWDDDAKPEYYSYDKEGIRLYSIDQAKLLAFGIMDPYVDEELPIM